MKAGIPLPDLATEIRRQADTKVDYVADTRRISIENIIAGESQWPMLAVETEGTFAINDLAHRQIGDRVKIPAKYYDRMRQEAPELLASNVNHWFNEAPEKRMLRTLDGKLRAFLSDRYRPLDNYDLAEAVIPTLAASGANIHSCEITETRMYIKAVIESVQREVPKPEGTSGYGYTHNLIINPGIVISNSEVGHGALAIQPAIHHLACTNMAVWAKSALRKHHVGRSTGGDDDNEIVQYFTDATRQLTDAALWSQVRDLTTAALQGDLFEDIVKQLQAARGDIINSPIDTVERLAERQRFTDGEHQGVLSYLVHGGDLSRYGLMNAVTRFSQDVESYDRATQLEQLGGEVITLSRNDWGALVN